MKRSRFFATATAAFATAIAWPAVSSATTPQVGSLTSMINPTNLSEHVYYQDEDNEVVELYTDATGWHAYVDVTQLGDLYTSNYGMPSIPFKAGAPMIAWFDGTTQHLTTAYFARGSAEYVPWDFTGASGSGYAATQIGATLAAAGLLVDYAADASGNVFEATGGIVGAWDGLTAHLFTGFAHGPLEFDYSGLSRQWSLGYIDQWEGFILPTAPTSQIGPQQSGALASYWTGSALYVYYVSSDAHIHLATAPGTLGPWVFTDLRAWG